VLIRKKKKMKDKGFLGAAKTTTKYPYKQVERSADMYPLGDESNFIIPKDEKKRENSPKGIKR